MLYITQRIEAMKSKDALTNRHAKVGKRLYMHHHHHHHLHHLYSIVWFLAGFPRSVQADRGKWRIF